MARPKGEVCENKGSFFGLDFLPAGLHQSDGGTFCACLRGAATLHEVFRIVKLRQRQVKTKSMKAKSFNGIQVVMILLSKEARLPAGKGRFRQTLLYNSRSRGVCAATPSIA